MITEVVQRSTERRTSFRPAGEVIDPRAYDVEPIDGATARMFVRTHHYARECSPTAHPFGLYQRGELAGVAVFGPPPSMNAHHAVFPTLAIGEAVTLGRFVLVDSVPGNGESWFLARCFEQLRAKGITAIESCSDPEPRAACDGRIIHRGHVGTIYCATNGHYVGKTNPATLWLLPDGTVFSNRASGKLKRGERNQSSPISQLVRNGADEPRNDEELAAWMELWRPQLTRKKRHHGNHRYIWCLDRRRRREVLAAPALPYPKIGLRLCE